MTSARREGLGRNITSVGPRYARRRVLVSAIVCVAGVVLMALAVSAVPASGAGQDRILRPSSIGGLKFGVATMAQAQKVFGRPLVRWRASVSGFMDPPVPFFAQAGVVVLGYPCASKSPDCWTFLAFRNSRLVALDSASTDIVTAGGTRVGTSLAKARRNDTGRWSGVNSQITALVYEYRYGGNSHISFKAYVNSKTLRVTRFFNSRSPAVGDGS